MRVMAENTHKKYYRSHVTLIRRIKLGTGKVWLPLSWLNIFYPDSGVHIIKWSIVGFYGPPVTLLEDPQWWNGVIVFKSVVQWPTRRSKFPLDDWLDYTKEKWKAYKKLLCLLRVFYGQPPLPPHRRALMEKLMSAAFQSLWSLKWLKLENWLL